MLKNIPKEYFDGTRGTLKLLWEEEWRALGITQVIKTLHVCDANFTDAIHAEFGMGTLRGARAGTAWHN